MDQTSPENQMREVVSLMPHIRKMGDEVEAVLVKGAGIGKSECLLTEMQAENIKAGRDVEGSFPIEIHAMPTRTELKAAFGASRSGVQPIRPTSKHGKDRNKKCPCGSGKKQKKCCLGRQEMNLQAAVRGQRELRTLAAAEALKAYQQAKGLP